MSAWNRGPNDLVDWVDVVGIAIIVICLGALAIFG